MAPAILPSLEAERPAAMIQSHSLDYQEDLLEHIKK